MKADFLIIMMLCVCLCCAGCVNNEIVREEPSIQASSGETASADAVSKGQDVPASMNSLQPETPDALEHIKLDPVRLEVGEKYSGALNTDGKTATVELILDPEAEDAEEDEDVYSLVVTDGDGKESRIRSESYAYMATAWVADLDEDGVCEIFFSQVYASDDRELQCWHYENGALKTLRFYRDADGQGNEYYNGSLEGIGEGEITIGAYVDMLGTRDATRPFVFDGACFKPVNASKWIFGDYFTSDDQETWNNYGLELAKDMPVTLDGKDATLKAGTKLLLTSTDYKSEADFILKDGSEGMLKVEHADDGWSWLIGGEPEQDWFTSYLPYSG